MDPPKLAVSKYGAFISVLASAGATSNFLLLVISVLASHNKNVNANRDQITPKYCIKQPPPNVKQI